MNEVEKYKKELESLSERWDLLTLLGQMSNVDMDMSETRQEFENLTSSLLEQLGKERLKNICLDINAKAQVAVDIIIRNLFERTADIGFLSTDEDIREYFTSLNTSNLSSYESPLKKELRQRFKEYVLKYSVYENVILVDNNNKVVLQLNESNEIKTTTSPFIEESITTSNDFVEYYGYTDLNPSKNNSLVYSFRVTETNDPSSNILGVLVLIFKFEDEMSGIFNNLLTKNDWSNISLINNNDEVISSSDDTVIRVGSKLEKALHSNYEIVRFAGQEFISKTCKTNGYQGFFGLGWFGHTMVPIAHAFNASSNQKTIEISKEKLDKIINNSNIFGEKLRTIPKEAEKIQRKLDVTVWNGNVKIANAKTNDNSFSRSLLQQISKTGLKTKTVFEDSISNLNNTVISSILNDGVFMAKLAIDIMDRNLYERANDCRWWALTTSFRKTLKNKSKSLNAKEMCETLSYINNLYTVYTNLFIYDKNGVVLAVSNQAENHLIGKKINDNWVNETLNLKNTQEYSVSDFNETQLYANKHTYIYSAKITCLEDSDETLGGIGIVFDSEPEFNAILEESLPSKQTEDQPNYFGVFCNNDKTIISSTNPDIKIGNELNIKNTFFDLKPGESYSEIVEYNNKYYAISAVASKGYREYKTQDNYTNEVIAIVFTEITDSCDGGESNKIIRKDPAYTYPKPQVDEETIDISTFFVGENVYGIESEYILSSLNNQPLTDLIGSDDYLIGVIVYKNKTINIVSLYSLITGDKFNYNSATNDIVLLTFEVNGEQQTLGLVVDDICDSSEVGTKDLQDQKTTGLGKSSLVKYIVSPEKGITKTELLAVLDIQSIYQRIINPA